MHPRWILVLVVIAACNGSSSQSSHDASNRTDGSSGADAATDSVQSADAAPDAPPCTKPQVFLSLDGVTITRGTGDDASQNVSSLLVQSTFAFAAVGATDATNLQAELSHTLSTYATIVAQRPAAPQMYMMIVVVPDSQWDTNALFGANISGGYISVCTGAPAPNHIGFVHENGDAAQVAVYVSAVAGVLAGLGATSMAGDCLNETTVPTANCQFYNGATGTGQCNAAGVAQDEITTMQTVYTCN